MKCFAPLGRLAIVAIVGAVIVHQAAAQPPDILRDYRFVSSKSNVHVSGGSQNYDMDLSIAGKFGLITGYGDQVTPTAHIPTLMPHAEFVDVHAILFNPLSAAPLPLPAWDLDKTLNLSGLNGTFSDPSVLHFTGVDGQGAPIKLDATLRRPLLHLTGTNFLPPVCAGCPPYIGYKVNALAHIAPYADFNLDGTIDGNDFGVLMANIGMATGASLEQGDADGDGDVDGEDFLVWQRSIGPAINLATFADSALGSNTVPEPATIGLLVVAAALIGIRRNRQARW